MYALLSMQSVLCVLCHQCVSMCWMYAFSVLLYYFMFLISVLNVVLMLQTLGRIAQQGERDPNRKYNQKSRIIFCHQVLAWGYIMDNLSLRSLWLGGYHLDGGIRKSYSYQWWWCIYVLKPHTQTAWQATQDNTQPDMTTIPQTTGSLHLGSRALIINEAAERMTNGKSTTGHRHRELCLHYSKLHSRTHCH